MPAAINSQIIHPPLVRGFQPGPDAILAQIRSSVIVQAKHIFARIPLFREEHGTFVTTAPTGEKLKLDDPAARQQVAKNAIGDYWELMNIAEFIFKFNKHQDAKVLFRIETTDFDIEFHDYAKCHKFLSDQEAEWIDWARGANAEEASAARRLT